MPCSWARCTGGSGGWKQGNSSRAGSRVDGAVIGEVRRDTGQCSVESQVDGQSRAALGAASVASSKADVAAACDATPGRAAPGGKSAERSAVEKMAARCGTGQCCAASQVGVVHRDGGGGSGW